MEPITKGRKIQVLTVCSAAHFLVDLACAYVVFRHYGGSAALQSLLLLYNFCAFALQMPLGILADLSPRRAGQIAAAGAALTALSFGAAAVTTPILTVTVAGLGNALFHVGGGLGSMSVAEEKAGPLGAFVSPGAVGLFLGGLLGKGNLGGALTVWLIPLLLLTAAVLLFCCGTADHADNREAERLYKNTSETAKSKAMLLASLLLLLLVVILRSHVGMPASFPWKKDYGLLFVLAVAGGKAAGGIASDRLGLVPVSVLSLLGSALFFLFPGLPFCGILGMFLFNMTMPVTLYRAALLLRGHRGFAFGLLTFGLFVGFLPTAFGLGSGLSTWLWALISLAILVPALLLPKGGTAGAP